MTTHSELFAQADRLHVLIRQCIESAPSCAPYGADIAASVTDCLSVSDWNGAYETLLDFGPTEVARIREIEFHITSLRAVAADIAARE